MKAYALPLAASAAIIAAAGILGGWATSATAVLTLAVLEVALSFDNAVVNAKYLGRFTPFWRTLFLTVGLAVAVFGMRAIFPILIVSAMGHINPATVVQLAVDGGNADTPGTYANMLAGTKHSIEAFGGMFLLMVFLEFVTDKSNNVWIPVEKMFKVGIEGFHYGIALAAALILNAVAGSHEVFTAAISGIATYWTVGAISEVMGVTDDDGQVTGKAAFGLFLFLEVLDASFSFDGVIGAFAVSTDIFVIMAGLGCGALFIRTMTIQLADSGKLTEYEYLENGAYWAIAALVASMFAGIVTEVPEWVPGVASVVFIASSVICSKLHKD